MPGKVTTDFNGGNDQPADLARQPDGKFVLVGVTYPANSNDPLFALARYNTNGSLDSGFGSGGKIIASSLGKGSAFSVLVLSDNKLLVLGQLNDGTATGSAILARYNSDGSPDNTFGTGGKVTHNGNTVPSVTAQVKP